MDPVWRAKIITALDGHYFHVVSGQWREFIMYLGRFEVGTEMEVIIRKPRDRTSQPQMRYYYGVVCKLIAEETGHEVDEIDSLLKWKFLKKIDDNGLEIVPSKTAMDTGEFTEYIEKVRRWASIALSVNIPDPNSVEGE